MQNRDLVGEVTSLVQRAPGNGEIGVEVRLNFGLLENPAVWLEAAYRAMAKDTDDRLVGHLIHI